MNQELIRQIVTFIAGILYIVAVVPYFISIHKKEIKPHPISWLLWTIIGGVNLIFYRQTGAIYSQIIAYASFFIPLTIFSVSLRSWNKSFSKLDYFCLFISIFSLIVGIIYKNPLIGLTLNIVLADFIAFLPTIIKTYKNPESENRSTWFITIIANILTLSVINNWTFAIVLLPLYTLFMNTIVWLETYRRKYIQ